jgi:hypothetical protein
MYMLQRFIFKALLLVYCARRKDMSKYLGFWTSLGKLMSFNPVLAYQKAMYQKCS